MSTDLDALDRAGRLMRDAARMMREEMAANPDLWAGGYRFNVDGALGGPAGKLAARFDAGTVDVIADEIWAAGNDLRSAAGRINRCDSPEAIRGAVRIARAYLGES